MKRERVERQLLTLHVVGERRQPKRVRRRRPGDLGVLVELAQLVRGARVERVVVLLAAGKEAQCRKIRLVPDLVQEHGVTHVVQVLPSLLHALCPPRLGRHVARFSAQRLGRVVVAPVNQHVFAGDQLLPAIGGRKIEGQVVLGAADRIRQRLPIAPGLLESHRLDVQQLEQRQVALQLGGAG